MGVLPTRPTCIAAAIDPKHAASQISPPMANVIALVINN